MRFAKLGGIPVSSHLLWCLQAHLLFLFQCCCCSMAGAEQRRPGQVGRKTALGLSPGPGRNFGARLRLSGIGQLQSIPDVALLFASLLTNHGKLNCCAGWTVIADGTESPRYKPVNHSSSGLWRQTRRFRSSHLYLTVQLWRRGGKKCMRREATKLKVQNAGKSSVAVNKCS